MNGNYEMPAMPKGAEEGILKGLYRFQTSSLKKPKAQAQLLGSGAILPGVIDARSDAREVRRRGRRVERDQLHRTAA